MQHSEAGKMRGALYSATHAQHNETQTPQESTGDTNKQNYPLELCFILDNYTSSGKSSATAGSSVSFM